MKKTKIFVLAIITLMIAIVTNNNVYATSEKNEVTLKFDGGIVRDGYVEYSQIGKLQLFRGDELVTNIDNEMKIDLNEADYKFVIEEIKIENTGSVVGSAPVKLNINNWYYPMTTTVGEDKSTFELESSKFNGTLNVKFTRARTVVNTNVENVYEDITSKGVIDLTDGKEYVIDFSKTDELTEGLKSFADLDKTLYYQKFNDSLLVTDNANVAVIKIVGNRSENKAILTAVNVETKKSENFKGFHMQYTGSSLNYNSTDDGIIYEIRYDHYTRCTYEFTFQYEKEEVSPKEYKFIEGSNQTYTIGKSKNAVFKVNTTAKDIKEIYIDGSILDAKNYVLDSQDGIITILDEYLKNLVIGEHKVKVTFLDEKEIVTNFEVKAEQSQSDIKGEEKNESIENTDPNPETGDNIVLIGMIFMMSMLGILSTKLKILDIWKKI